MRAALVAAAALVLSACGDVAEPPLPQPAVASPPAAAPAPARPASVPKSPLADFDVLDAPVTPPPQAMQLDAFYGKYTNAGGIPVVSSAKVSDHALLVARTTVLRMLVKRADVKKMLVDKRVRVVVMARGEKLTDVPECRDIRTRYPRPKTGGDWDAIRGVFATFARPQLCICAEENLLREDRDSLRGDNALVHEMAHTIDLAVLRRLPGSSFEHDLSQAYEAAMRKGLWRKAYAATDKEEYWAEGACAWFDANLSGRAVNDIRTRSQLREYDPALSNLLSDVFPADDLGLATTK